MLQIIGQPCDVVIGNAGSRRAALARRKKVRRPKIETIKPPRVFCATGKNEGVCALAFEDRKFKVTIERYRGNRLPFERPRLGLIEKKAFSALQAIFHVIAETLKHWKVASLQGRKLIRNGQSSVSHGSTRRRFHTAWTLIATRDPRNRSSGGLSRQSRGRRGRSSGRSSTSRLAQLPDFKTQTLLISMR
jgi:hypothetical protein